MNSKAQIFSLDLLIAAGLVFLAVALAINSIESISFSGKNNFDLMELQYVALTASDRFVSIAKPCAKNDVNVLNCIVMPPLVSSKIQKETLGIPDSFAYVVDDEFKKYFELELLPAPEDKPQYNVKRIFLKSNTTEMDESTVELKQITFTVWKK